MPAAARSSSRQRLAKRTSTTDGNIPNYRPPDEHTDWTTGMDVYVQDMQEETDAERSRWHPGHVVDTIVHDQDDDHVDQIEIMFKFVEWPQDK